MTKQKKTIEIKNKFINHLTIKGKKSQSEKIIFKNLKTLQKTSKKPLKKLIQLALVANAPVFKLNTITQKKRKKKKQKARIIPAFISDKTVRISFAIKFIVTASQKRNDPLLTSLSKEILASSKNESNAIEFKKESQRQAVLNRHLFKYYRWH
jgi:ribosomal protein S7